MWKNLALLAVVSALCLIVLEIGSRFLMPIHPGTVTTGPLDADGRGPQLSLPMTGLLEPGRYRMEAAEFDLEVEIAPAGHRAPAEDDPRVLILGDSFAFGQGLADDANFAYLWGTSRGERFANIARPGTGTWRQAELLELYLETQPEWRPELVKLVMLVNARRLHGGSDFADSVGERRASAGEIAEASEDSVLQKARSLVLGYSNLARIGYFVAGAQLRRLLPEAEQAELETAFEATARALDRLKAIADERGFEIEIFVLHPVQSFALGDIEPTVAKVRELAPEGVVVKDTSPCLADDPTRYYFPFDGHLNPAGARAIVDCLD